MKEKWAIFLTFVFSCLAIGLLIGCLASDHWVEANARRESNVKSEGRVNFGLFKVSTSIPIVI